MDSGLLTQRQTTQAGALIEYLLSLHDTLHHLATLGFGEALRDARKACQHSTSQTLSNYPNGAFSWQTASASAAKVEAP